jgi:capsular exopolysaccharide synthesis family protein
MIKTAKKASIDTGNIGLLGVSSIIAASPDVDINKILATSRPIIEKMVSKLQLRDDGGNLTTAERLTRTGVMSTMRRRLFSKPHLTISQYQDTDILQITANSSNRDEAMMMANTLSAIMVDENQNQMRAEYRSARIFLEDRITKEKGRYGTALRKLADFKKRTKTVDLGTEARLATEKMAELLKKKEDDVINLAEARAKLNRLKEQLAKEGPEFLSASALQDNPQIEILKRRLTDLRLELSQATADLTERHPRVLSLKEQISMAEAELEGEIATYRASAPELVSLESQVAALEVHLEGVNADLERYFKTLGGLPEKAFNQANLDMDLNASQRVYSSLLDYLYQISVAEAITLSEIRIVDPAIIPRSPASPNKVLNGILGLFLGLVFGVALAFIVEYVDDTVRTPEDVKEFRPIGLIGTVHRFKKEKILLISGKDPNDPLYESYRKIRNNLRFVDEKPVRSFLITCAGPGEGKSTTAINLGISVAREGKRVVIVDSDLRRPVIHKYLEISNEVGVTDILQEITPMDEAIQPTHIQGLSAITSGSAPADPGGLIESDFMEHLVSELSNRFDLVILDSAPLLVKSDALILAKHVEGTIVVLESGKTTRHAIHEMMEILANASVRPLGFVLNKLPLERGRYSYHHQYYGAKYLPESTSQPREDGRRP